jgi:hypothetical protein
LPDLERELRDLGLAVEFPGTPDLTGVVGERLRAAAAPRRLRLRPLVVAFAALALALAAALAVPPARSAIFDLLGIGGAEIERVPTQPRAPVDADLALGERIALEDAPDAVDFDVLVPPVSGARAYVDRSVPGGKVSFVWRDDGRRLLLSEFRGEVLVEKEVGPRTRVEYLLVRGATGAWITGAGHAVIWRDAHGNAREETRRLAGNVLLWQDDGVTFRLEGVRARAEALAIARSLERDG